MGPPQKMSYEGGGSSYTTGATHTPPPLKMNGPLPKHNFKIQIFEKYARLYSTLKIQSQTM